MVQSNGATNNAGIMMIATDNSMSSGSYSLNGGSLQTTSLTIGGNTFGYITPTFTQQSGTCSCRRLYQLNPTGQYNLNGPGLLLNVGQTEIHSRRTVYAVGRHQQPWRRGLEHRRRPVFTISARG